MSSKKDKQQRTRETDELFDKVREQVADARRLSAKFAERARGAEPPTSCPKHPIGTEQPCGPCGTARLRHLMWARGLQGSKDLDGRDDRQRRPGCNGDQGASAVSEIDAEDRAVGAFVRGVLGLVDGLKPEAVGLTRVEVEYRPVVVELNHDSSSRCGEAVAAAGEPSVGAAVDGDGPVVSSPPGEATQASLVVRLAMSEEQRQRLLLALSTARAGYMDRHFRAVQELAASETKERRESFAGIASDWAREADLVDELSSLIGGAVRS